MTQTTKPASVAASIDDALAILWYPEDDPRILSQVDRWRAVEYLRAALPRAEALEVLVEAAEQAGRVDLNEIEHVNARTDLRAALRRVREAK